MKRGVTKKRERGNLGKLAVIGTSLYCPRTLSGWGEREKGEALFERKNFFFGVGIHVKEKCTEVTLKTKRGKLGGGHVIGGFSVYIKSLSTLYLQQEMGINQEQTRKENGKNTC